MPKSVRTRGKGGKDSKQAARRGREPRQNAVGALDNAEKSEEMRAVNETGREARKEERRGEEEVGPRFPSLLSAALASELGSGGGGGVGLPGSWRPLETAGCGAGNRRHVSGPPTPPLGSNPSAVWTRRRQNEVRAPV